MRRRQHANGDGCSATCQLQEICTDLTDNDNDGLIDCDDPDCQCQVFGKDPAAIIFRPTKPGHDYFKVHGRMIVPNLAAALSGKFGILLTNANGVIYKGVLLPGDLKPKGSGAIFSDKTASKGPGTRDGLSKVKIKNKGTYVQVEVKAYGNLSSGDGPADGRPGRHRQHQRRVQERVAEALERVAAEAPAQLIGNLPRRHGHPWRRGAPGPGIGPGPRRDGGQRGRSRSCAASAGVATGRPTASRERGHLLAPARRSSGVRGPA